jgi:hypothetical protein
MRLGCEAAVRHLSGMSDAAPSRPKRSNIAYYQWYAHLAQMRGQTISALARAAGIAPATLLRQGYPDWKWAPKLDTLQKLADVTGEPIPAALIGPVEPAGFGEPELQPVGPEADENRPFHLSRWTVNTDALAAAGIFRGDDIWFDSNLKPEAEDVVIANVYKGVEAETVMRVWMPPFLVAAEKGRPSIAPIEVHGDHPRAVILGTMTEVRRRRQPGRADAA